MPNGEGYAGKREGTPITMPSIPHSVKPLIDRGTPGMSDQRLKSKIESAPYRLPGVARSKVEVTVADRVVTVHGQARNRAHVASLETAVRAVGGDESRLHLPKAATPVKAGRSASAVARVKAKDAS